MTEPYDYDKVIEFFSEHETSIYGLGPTDDGAEEGTLLWCIKELDDIYNRSERVILADKGPDIKDQILKVLCSLMDIYEEEEHIFSEREREQYDALRRDVMDIYREREEKGK